MRFQGSVRPRQTRGDGLRHVGDYTHANLVTICFPIFLGQVFVLQYPAPDKAGRAGTRLRSPNEFARYILITVLNFASVFDIVPLRVQLASQPVAVRHALSSRFRTRTSGACLVVVARLDMY